MTKLFSKLLILLALIVAQSTFANDLTNPENMVVGIKDRIKMSMWYEGVDSLKKDKRYPAQVLPDFLEVPLSKETRLTI